MSPNVPRGGGRARGLEGELRADWPLKRSSDIFELRYGRALVEANRRPGAVPVFGTNGQAGVHDQALFPGPGVIIGRKGAGHLGVHWTDSDFWVIDTAYSLIPSDEVHLKFAYYLVNFVGLNHLKHGTSNPSLTRDAFGAQYFPVPPLDEQMAIAATLGALDDKIESNRRLVTYLERLISHHFERLISSSAVEWRALADLTSVTKGVSYKSLDLRPSRTSLVTLKSFDRTGGYKAEGLKPYVGPYKPEQVIQPGEIVVAQTDLTQGAEVVGRAVRVPADSTSDVLVASLDLAIVRPAADISNEYLLGVLTDEAFRQHCRSRTSGTTVLHLAPDALPSYKVPLISEASRAWFTSLSQPLLARMDAAEREVVRLTELRGSVLPELLSGRMVVPVEEMVA